MSPQRTEALRFQRPTFPPPQAIEDYLSRSRAERWYSNSGPCCRLLSRRLSERTGAYCVPVASGTAGLMAAIAALGPDMPAGSHDAVMPSFTFPATAQAAGWAGLSPRLLDVDPAHWHLDEQGVATELAAAPPALVVAVSSFGTPPPAAARTAWESACARAGVPLLVDSAAGFGAIADDGVPVGRQGDVEVVSFHATKPFAVGEGGAVFCRSAHLHERIERAVNFGFDGHRRVVGGHALNGKMSELHAAVALAVLDGYDETLARRREHARTIRGLIGDAVTWQRECERSTWQFVPVALADEDARAAVLGEAAGRIETRVYYAPLHREPAFAGTAVGRAGLPVTEELSQRMLCLPMADDLAPAEISAIAGSVTRAVDQPRPIQRSL